MHHGPHKHHPKHHGWGPWGGFSQPPTNTLVTVNQQATAIATDGGTAIAMNISYIYIF